MDIFSRYRELKDKYNALYKEHKQLEEETRVSRYWDKYGGVTRLDVDGAAYALVYTVLSTVDNSPRHETATVFVSRDESVPGDSGRPYRDDDLKIAVFVSKLSKFVKFITRAVSPCSDRQVGYMVVPEEAIRDIQNSVVPPLHRYTIEGEDTLARLIGDRVNKELDEYACWMNGRVREAVLVVDGEEYDLGEFFLETDVQIQEYAKAKHKEIQQESHHEDNKC